MFALHRSLRRLGNSSCFALSTLIFTGLAAICSTALAQGTHLWLQSQMQEFEKGTPDGVAIESDGQLRRGPGSTEQLTTPSTFVWAVVEGKSGKIFAATGTPATVLRLPAKKGEKPFTLFATKDLSVQALCLGPDGGLYAATMPSGRVYKLNPDATETQDDTDASVVFDAAKAEAAASQTNSPKSSNQSHYIWALTFDSAGRLYIAAGNPGAVYRVDPAKPNAAPELFFQSDEAHIRALAWDGKGNLIAGSDGSGLVYRIDPQGKGYILFEAPRREITSIAIGAKGTIYAASVGDKSRIPLPPLPVQGIGGVSITIVTPGSLQAANASASAPEGTEIYALADGQAPRKLWSNQAEIVYALAARPDGLLALTGNRGRVFLIQDDGSYADVAHLEAQQGLSLTTVQDAEGMGEVVIGTGNTGKVFLLGPAEKHEYASDVLDAGAFARFGRIEADPDRPVIGFLPGSGNVEQPVRGWSDWQPLNDGSVASPAGRFLQWKAELGSDGKLSSVGVNYLPVNSAPVVDDVVVVPGARLNAQNAVPENQTVNISFSSAGDGSTITFDAGSNSSLQATKDRSAVTARWAAHDEDGDDLIYSLYLRGDGETVWRLLKDKIAEKAYSFDAATIPDGGYRIKVVASDAPSHTPGDALTGVKVSDRFVIDTTPPAIENLKAEVQPSACPGRACGTQLLAGFDAEDPISPIARAQYSLDAGTWQFIGPVGKLSDSRREHYEFHVELPPGALTTEHLITVRVYDRYDNVGVAKTVIPAGEK